MIEMCMATSGDQSNVSRGNLGLFLPEYNKVYFVRCNPISALDLLGNRFPGTLELGVFQYSV